MDYNFPVPSESIKIIDSGIIQEKSSSMESIENAVSNYLAQYSRYTIKAYKSDLQTWWDYSHKNVRESTEQDVLYYIKYLEKKGYQNSTINRKLAALSKIFNIYISLGLATKNPVRDLSSITRIFKPVNSMAYVIVTKHDIEAVICNAKKKTANIVRFLSNTGLRISEMIEIRKEDLEPFDKDYIRVRIIGKGKKIRFIFIPYSLYLDVKEVFDSDSTYLFTSRTGRSLSRVNIYKQINTAFLRYAYKSNITCHSLRHFYATEKIVNEKKDFKAVSKYLGHSSVSTTLNLYTHSQLEPNETQIF